MKLGYRLFIYVIEKMKVTDEVYEKRDIISNTLEFIY